MGQLEAACFSSGSNNTLYALAFGYDLSTTTGADNAIVALIKSNSSPAGPNDLTWQVVSTVHQAELSSFGLISSIGQDYQIQCLVDPNGGFLAWSYQAQLPGQTGFTFRPGGFRYDPFSTTPSATTTGKGGWVNVDSPITYSWYYTSLGGALMYLADGTGKYNYYQAFIPTPDGLGNFINFGALNTAVTPNLMENSVTRWSLNSTGDSRGIGISATNIFAYGSDSYGNPSFSVATIPQSGPLPTTAPLFQSVNYTAAGNCASSRVFDSSIYTYCEDSKLHGVQYSLYDWDGSKASGPISMSQLPTPQIYTSAISGIFGDPTSTTYMLVQYGNIGSDDPSSGTILKALVLTGGGAGSVLDVPNNITVPDNLSFYNANGHTGGFGLTSLVKVVVGIFGSLFAIGFAFGIIVRKRRQNFVVMQEQPSVMMVTTTKVVAIA